MEVKVICCLIISDKTNVELLKRIIRVLLVIAKLYKLGCMILPEIVTLLSNNVNTDVCITALLNIQKLIASGKFDFNIHQFLYEKCNIIDKLISYETNIIDHKMLICNVCQLIVRNLTTEKQRTIVTKYAATLDMKSPEAGVSMTMNLLIPLRKDVNLYINEDMMENLYNLATSDHSSQYTRQITCKFISVFLNKMKVYDLNRIVSYLEGKVSSHLEVDIDVELEHTVDLQVWITKALIMKEYDKFQNLLENVRVIHAYEIFE